MVPFPALKMCNLIAGLVGHGCNRAAQCARGPGGGFSAGGKGHITLARLLVDLGNISAAAVAGPTLLHVCGRLSGAAPAGAGVCCRLHGMDGVCGALARCAG